MFGRLYVEKTKQSYSESIGNTKAAIADADAVVIGAGSGLSTAAGYTYSGERFHTYFRDFIDEYGIRDIYSGGFYPFPDMEIYWAWWSRHIWVNRYMPIPNDVYNKLLNLVKDKDYFVLTTNVDHCFQRSGFDRKRLFYTQGDYGLFQSSNPHGISAHKTYDNREIVEDMLLAQGFEIGENDELRTPKGKKLSMRIPTELIPYCPDDGELMTTNLRSDDKFVEDDGWHIASGRYSDFIRRHDDLQVVYLEIGVGGNTPVIIKYPFWKYTAQNENATYVCINKGEAVAPHEIMKRSLCLDEDIGRVLDDLK